MKKVDDIKIFTTGNCSYCETAKSLLKTRGLPFSETKIGKDISRADFLNQYPSQRTVPMILLNGKRLGGLTELQTFLEMKNDNALDNE